jgi:cellobiose phosphorylase
VLETECLYLDRSTQHAGSRASWLDHCLRGIDRALDRRSRRGLPLILAGDWNDGLSHAGLDGKGESVWVGMFLYDILRRWSAILPGLGLSDRAKTFGIAADELREAVNAYGWDGEWYLEGTTDDGRPLGSRENASGQIFLNPQTWAVITGIAPPERAAKAMASVRERLIKPYGALLLHPAYSKVDPWVGYITRYAPGSRENGGVYSHASTWAVQALAMMGEPAAALDLYRSMLPSAKTDQSGYAAEPYVMPGNVDGPDSPNEGRAGWTWYTGSSGWMLQVAYDWICGIRATRDGLRVCPPSNGLGEYRVRRKFRGDRFDISVSGSGRQVAMTCDTARVEGNLVRSTGQGANHEVRVILS